jgi:hypothetical protein
MTGYLKNFQDISEFKICCSFLKIYISLKFTTISGGSPNPLENRVGNFRRKNYSAEDGIDGTIGLFRRNSGYSAEQKIIGIPVRTVPQRRKMLGILYHGTKLEANAWNSLLNHSTEEKTTRTSVPWNKNICKHLEFCSEPFRGRDNNSDSASNMS